MLVYKVLKRIIFTIISNNCPFFGTRSADSRNEDNTVRDEDGENGNCSFGALCGVPDLPNVCLSLIYATK